MAGNVLPESGAGQDVVDELEEAIRRRAEQIYERNGKIPGRDIENWTQAEREIRSEAAQQVGGRTAVVVKVDGVEYVGEYEFAAADGYAPGEFAAGDPIAVRFEDEKMYVKRANGKELETRIVKTYS
jgi:hypothetical protein